MSRSKDIGDELEFLTASLIGQFVRVQTKSMLLVGILKAASFDKDYGLVISLLATHVYTEMVLIFWKDIAFVDVQNASLILDKATLLKRCRDSGLIPSLPKDSPTYPVPTHYQQDSPTYPVPTHFQQPMPVAQPSLPGVVLHGIQSLPPVLQSADQMRHYYVQEIQLNQRVPQVQLSQQVPQPQQAQSYQLVPQLQQAQSSQQVPQPQQAQPYQHVPQPQQVQPYQQVPQLQQMQSSQQVLQQMQSFQQVESYQQFLRHQQVQQVQHQQVPRLQQMQSSQQVLQQMQSSQQVESYQQFLQHQVQSHQQSTGEMQLSEWQPYPQFDPAQTQQANQMQLMARQLFNIQHGSSAHGYQLPMSYPPPSAGQRPAFWPRDPHSFGPRWQHPRS